MFTTKKKIHKDNGAEPTEFEENVAQVNLRWKYDDLWLKFQYDF